MKFLAALAAVVASTQASYIAGAYHGAIAAPVAHAVPAVAPAVVPAPVHHAPVVTGYSGTPLDARGLPVGHVVPGPQVVGAVAQGPNVLPSRAHLPAPRVVEHAPQVAHHVEPVEQWGYSVNY